MFKLNVEILKKMMRAVLNTRNDEIGCGECFERLDRFIELKLEGKSPEAAMPLVKDHLERCGECQEDYEALLIAVNEFNRK